MEKITSANMARIVSKIFGECLCESGERKCMICGATKRNYAFNPTRLRANREIIREMVNQLKIEPEKHVSISELWTTKDGTRWVNNNAPIQWLVAMAIGLRILAYFDPKDNKEKEVNEPTYHVIIKKK